MNKKTILIVEDEKELRELYSDIFTDFDLTFAVTGRLAIDIIQEHPLFDLYIMDIGLPDMDGYEVMQNLRNWYQQARIMVITGYPLQNISHKLIAIKPDKVLTKPFDMVHLINSVDELTQQSLQPFH
jgi:CheY-like chemotaxis protein